MVKLFETSVKTVVDPVCGMPVNSCKKVEPSNATRNAVNASSG